MMKTVGFILLLLVSKSILWAQSFDDKERMIALSIEINAPLDSVWSRWTTDSGRKKFFAPSSRFELTTLGYMEILFMPQAPEGQRGAENNRVLAVQDKQMITFTWDAPPKFPEIRKQRTVVMIRFYKTGEAKSVVTLHHMGWGTGKEWDEVFNYFSGTWAAFVLPNLKYSLEVKSIDWNDFPDKLPKGLKPAMTLVNK
jgi:uncharacterized protein YndB with AHSA1/START domain